MATLPALRSFGSAFIADGAPGEDEPGADDHLQAVYRFWLVGHQLERGAAPWRDPYSFQPLVEPQPVFSGWPFGLPFWPLEAAFGPVVAWNTLLLATVVAAGLLVYGWLRALPLDPLPAAAGGLAFAIAPYRLAQSGVHLLAWIAILVPLALLAFERGRAADGGRRAHAWGALAAAALVSIPLSGQLHLALGVIPLVALYAAIRPHPVASWWAAGGVAASATVGLVLYVTVVSDSAEGQGRTLEEVANFSASWLDLVSRRRLQGLEEFVYVGWLLPVLGAVGVALLWRSRRRGLAALLGAAALVPPLLALGTNFAPYEWLWHAFPPLRYPRVPGRFMPIANLALAALAAVAVARLVASAGRRATLAGAALLALVAADLLVFPLASSAADPDNRAYAALRRAPEGRVLELPLVEPGVHYGNVYDYYQLQARRERPGGYSTLVPAPAVDFFFRHNRLSCGVWLPEDQETLQALGVRHVAFHRGVYAQADVPGAWFAWRELRERGFSPVVQDGAVTLFSRGSERGGVTLRPPVPEPARARPVLCEGWEGDLMRERQAPLWLWAEGRVRLEVSAVAETPAVLWVDGAVAAEATVSGDAVLEADLGAEGWHALVLELPALLPTSPAQGLRLERIGLFALGAS